MKDSKELHTLRIEILEKIIIIEFRVEICIYINRGKTSWADSHFDYEEIADVEQTRRFLIKFYDDLNSDGIE